MTKDITTFTGEVTQAESARGRTTARRAGPVMAAVAALLLAACSTTPDWTRPSTISDSITGKSPSEPTNETVAAAQGDAEAASDNAEFPAAGSTPSVPDTGDSADKRDLADSLVADRQHARYSGEALRGGTEPPASPLPSRRVAPVPDLPASATAADTSSDVAKGQVIPAPQIPDYQAPATRIGEVKDGEYVPRAVAEREASQPVAETAQKAASDATTAVRSVEVSTLPAPSAPAQATAAAPQAATAPVAAPVQQAASAPTRRPAVPARSVPTYERETAAAETRQAAVAVRAPQPVSQPSSVTVSGAPQFETSKAPPLPAEVLSQVPAVVSARFAETRAETGAPAAAASAPVATDGVVIDYSAIGAGSPVPDESSFEQGSAPIAPVSAYENLDIGGAEGGPFTPVAVYFGHGSSGLSAADRAEIRDIAKLQAKRGGGTVRVVGHASSRTSNLPVESHLLANFDMSLKRANAVAAELMKQGVAAADLVIEAQGDQAPVFYESMPAGEAGNRRAEIFLE